MNWTSATATDDVVLKSGGDPATTMCYEHAVPPFVEDAIEREYGSLFATLPHLRHTGKLTSATSTYVRHVDGKLQALLLFDRVDRHVTVLNELIHLSAGEIAAFVGFVFARYGTVTTISFNAVRADLSGLHHPSQHYFCSEDIVIPTLASVNEYAGRLKKSTRKSVRRHGNALLRAHPTANFTVLAAQAIDETLVRTLVDFNRARMANKDRVSAYTDDESQWIAALASARGLAVVVTIDGHVCAGAVCCNIGDSFFLLVTAHDPAYDHFGLGMLCSYRTVCECIARSCKEVHLLWGRLAYKTSLGGEPRRFDRINIYRDCAAYLRHLDQALLAAATGLTRELRLYLLNAEGQPTAQGRAADLVWRYARGAKRTVNAIWRRT